MPFGIGKMFLNESPGTMSQGPGNTNSGGGGGGGGNGTQPDSVNLRSEWRADKVITIPGYNTGVLAVTRVLNQIVGGPDLIVPPGYLNPILLTNTSYGAAYAVGDANIVNGFVPTYVNFGFIGPLDVPLGCNTSLQTARPIYGLTGSAISVYILGYDSGGPGNDTFIGHSQTNTWHFDAVTTISEGSIPSFANNTYRRLVYSDLGDGSQAQGFAEYNTADIWIATTVINTANAGGPIGSGESQILFFRDQDYLTGPTNTVNTPNYITEGQANNLGSSNAFSNGTFGISVPNTSLPSIYNTAYPGTVANIYYSNDLTYYTPGSYPTSVNYVTPSGIPGDTSQVQSDNLGNRNFQFTHIMIYQGAHTFAQRQAVRAYLTNIWGHVNQHYSVYDSASTPGG